MVRKSLIAFAGLLALLVVAFGVTALFSSETVVVKSPKAKPAPRPAAWNGAGSQQLNVTTPRGDATISLLRADYTRLNSPAAGLTVTVHTNTTTTGKRPSWLTSRTFRLASDDLRIFKPAKTTIKRAGDRMEVTLRYAKLPTARLQAGYSTDKTRALGLTTFSPTGSYRVLMLPPAPPAGHKWAESPGDKPMKGSRFTDADRTLDRVARALARGEEDPRVVAKRRARERAAAQRAARAAKARKAAKKRRR